MLLKAHNTFNKHFLVGAICLPLCFANEKGYHPKPLEGWKQTGTREGAF